MGQIDGSVVAFGDWNGDQLWVASDGVLARPLCQKEGAKSIEKDSNR